MSKGKDLINSIKYGLYRMLTKQKRSGDRSALDKAEFTSCPFSVPQELPLSRQPDRT